ncbi:MAG: universal stress protein, partial [Solirubrobacteraceae bacterium]
MATPVIVSYDGTTNDDDALALGRMLTAGGAKLALAYVRHSREYDPRREEIGVSDADRRLEQGAQWLDPPEVDRHVVVDPSTGAGLARLAASEGAQLILFGSDYRTPP